MDAVTALTKAAEPTYVASATTEGHAEGGQNVGSVARVTNPLLAWQLGDPPRSLGASPASPTADTGTTPADHLS